MAWLAGDLFISNAGDWEYSNNWTAGSPTASTDVQLVSSDGRSRTISSSSNNAASTLIIDATNGGTMKLSQQSGKLTVANESVGFVGTGTFIQSFSTHTVTGTLTLGAKPGSVGTYSLGYSATLSAAALSINSGSSFSQTGGTLTATSLVNDGSFAQSAGSASPSSITGTGSISLSGTASLSTSSIHQSSISLANAATAKLTPSASSSALSSLTLSNTASLDLTTDTLQLTYPATSPVDTIRQYLLNHQLISSSANATYRLAYSDSNHTITIRLALSGDANMDDQVDADDYALLDRSLAVSRTNAHWTDGDFNYDGQIDASDYLLLDTAFCQAQGFSPGFLSLRESQFGPTYVSELLTSIPEPSLLAACGLTLLPLTRRRPRT